jgi:hypothetical protein
MENLFDSVGVAASPKGTGSAYSPLCHPMPFSSVAAKDHKQKKKAKQTQAHISALKLLA